MSTKRDYEKHGGTHTKAYRVWWDMLRRCQDTKMAHYDRYGGRGVKVCDEWANSFATFWKDMGDPPPGLTLDRIDNDKGYAKSNCRWISRWEQSVNRSDNVTMTIKGVTKSIAEWVRESGLPYVCVYWRKVHAGWPDEKCLQKSTRKPHLTIEHGGKRYSILELANLLNISTNSVRLRIKAGWSAAEIINRPNSQPYKKKGWRFTQ